MNINNIHQADSGDSVQKLAVRPVEPADTVTRSSPLAGKSAVDQAERAEERKQQSPDVSDVKEMADALNEYMDILHTNLGFSIREELNHQVVVEIKNRDTDELVKQIPSEELLKIMENMKELTGIIFDQSV